MRKNSKTRWRDSIKSAWLGLVSAIGMSMLLGCAAPRSPSTPELVRSVQLTPLPSSVAQIDSAGSVLYLMKAKGWLQKLSESLKDETVK